MEALVAAIERFTSTANDPATAPGHRKQLCYSIASRWFDLWIARYGAHAPLAELRSTFDEVVTSQEAYRQLPGSDPFDFKAINVYIDALWMLSIGILLEVDDATIQRIVKMIGQNRKDWLFDRLTRTRIPTQLVHGELAHPKVYGELRTAMRAKPEDRPALIAAFAKTYEQAEKKRHFDDEARAPFSRWSFELAALAKTSNLPDDDFAASKRYPADLVRRAGS